MAGKLSTEVLLALQGCTHDGVFNELEESVVASGMRLSNAVGYPLNVVLQLVITREAMANARLAPRQVVDDVPIIVVGLRLLNTGDSHVLGFALESQVIVLLEIDGRQTCNVATDILSNELLDVTAGISTMQPWTLTLSFPNAALLTCAA